MNKTPKILIGCGSLAVIGLIVAAILGFVGYRNLFPSPGKDEQPDVVGKFKLTKPMKSQGSFTGMKASHLAEYTADGPEKHVVTYWLGSFMTEAGAREEMDGNKCSNKTGEKTGLLKSKSGQMLGDFRDCTGTLHMRNGSKTVTLYRYSVLSVGSTTRADEADDAEVADFIKNLPFNADVDMKSLAAAFPSLPEVK